MRTLTKLYVVISACILSGCVSNGITVGLDENTPNNAVIATQKVFVGVPLLLGMEGSVVSIGNGWYITAAHNRAILELQLKDVIYHPECDVALFREEGDSDNVQLSIVIQGETTYTVGYPLSSPISSSKGVYVGDVVEPNSTCVYSATTSKVTSGMSGGGVWTQDGKLVGVIRGVLKEDVHWEDGRSVSNPSVFVSVNYIRDWIFNHTGILLEE